MWLLRMEALSSYHVSINRLQQSPLPMCLFLIVTELGTLNDHFSCSCGKLLNFIEEWKS